MPWSGLVEDYGVGRQYHQNYAETPALFTHSSNEKAEQPNWPEMAFTAAHKDG